MLKTIGDNVGVNVVAWENDGSDRGFVQRTLSMAQLTIRTELPAQRLIVTLDERDTYMGALRLVDAVTNALVDGAARMRGNALREWLDLKKPVDFVGDKDEHEASERYGAALIELGEALMRRAKEAKR